MSAVAERSDAAAARWLQGIATTRDSGSVVRALHRQVAEIDRLITEQVNAILHHPLLQALEARWRGLAYLTGREPSDGGPPIKIKVLAVSWVELARDLDQAIDFDQSEFFRKVYEYEFGSPGGEPFGAIIGDYEIHLSPPAGSRYDDVEVLKGVAGVAAAAFCPFFVNATPEMFGLSDFAGLQQSLDHVQHLRSFQKWQALRDHEDARFVGCVLPRVLMRRPYQAAADRVDGFSFNEDVAGPDARKYLWGGAAFALGAVVLRAFENAAWPANIRGVQRGVDAGGLVTGLVMDEPGTDSRGVAHKYVTDVVISDDLEKQLGDLGFIPLCQCHGVPYAGFYSVPSIQSPRTMDRTLANANAKISSLIPHMLCVSRFAHYVKVMARNRIGAVNPDELEAELQEWLMRYVVNDDNASPETKARNPLRDARVRILAKPGAPGSYRCVIHLVPHYELDDMAVKVRLTTDIASPGVG